MKARIKSPGTRIVGSLARGRGRLVALCGAPLLVALWLFRGDVSALWQTVNDREQMAAWTRHLGPWAPLVLGTLLMLQVIIPLIPGQAVVLTIGYLYGPLWGSVFTAVILFLSGELAFAIARKAGRPAVRRLTSAHALEKWEPIGASQGVLFYSCIFTVPFLPSDLMVYVAGLGNISPRRFALANLLGRLPLSVWTTVLGAYHLQPPAGFWALPPVIILLAVAGLVRAISVARLAGLVHLLRSTIAEKLSGQRERAHGSRIARARSTWIAQATRKISRPRAGSEQAQANPLAE